MPTLSAEVSASPVSDNSLVRPTTQLDDNSQITSKPSASDSLPDIGSVDNVGSASGSEVSSRYLRSRRGGRREASSSCRPSYRENSSSGSEGSSNGSSSGIRGLGRGRISRAKAGRGFRTRRGSSSRNGSARYRRGSTIGRGSTVRIRENQTQLVTVSNPWTRGESGAFCFNYTCTPGPTCSLLNCDSSFLDFFSRFFTDDVWMLLVTETNLYANNNYVASPSSREWSPVSMEEMKAFLGLLILIAILKLPRLEMYWSKQHPIIETPGISNVMSRNRFQQIFRFFHLTSSSVQVHSVGHPGYDRLFKVRKFLDLVCPKFENEYTPHKQVTIDEAMIPFKGRLSFKQYLKDKPIKWGIKVFVLSDAHNGYVYRLQVYTGKDLSNVSDVGLCTKVVLDLMSGLESFHHELYTDNYYTSPSLYLTLYSRGVNACGTVRPNRKGFPQDLVTKATIHNRSYYNYRSSGPLLATVWVDKRSIYFLSTMHVAESTEESTVKRRKPDGLQEDVLCPPLLPDYQAYMRGVDRGDQLIGYYNAGRRSKKWWKRVFCHILECSILNAYVLYKTVPSTSPVKKVDYLHFRLGLAESLIGSFSSRKRVGRQRSEEHLAEDRLNKALDHWPENAGARRLCVVCSKHGQVHHLTRLECRHESNFRCSHCKVHLCIHKERECFKKYHTLVQFWR